MTPQYKAPVPDSKAAVDFLTQYSQEQPVVLTAISLGRHPTINGIVIKPKEFKVNGRVFLEKYNGKANIYFSVNPVVDRKRSVEEGPLKKAKKEDLAFFTHLHIDVDPEGGKPIDAERDRILKKLQTFEPEPSIIIDSGGGYQGFWILSDPVTIKDVAHVQDLEGYNIQLALMLGGDACHNLDRIMRLPGTINIPTPTKVKKGRVEALAKVIHFKGDLVYKLESFIKAKVTGTPSKEKKPLRIKEEMKGDLNFDPDSLDVLPISQRMKELIIHGEDPEEPERWPSRSECLFHVICGLIREEQSDEIIYSIITNSDFKISGSVLDAPNSKRYAEKQINRAKENVTKREDESLSKLSQEERATLLKMDRNTRRRILSLPPEQLAALLELNGNHCVVREAGKVRVLNEEYDEILERFAITRSTFEDLRNFYSNRYVKTVDIKGDDVHVKLGKWWLEQSMRRQYEKILFYPKPPGEVIENDPKVYNLFRGYSVVPKEEGDWSIFKQHMFENICTHNQEYYNYLIGWMANAIQHPAKPGQIGVVLRGDKGTGKSKFAKVFGNLFGQHFLHVSNPKHLIGNFNRHLRDAIVVFADEAIWAGDKAGEGVLKMLITEETIIIEGKGIDPICCPNFTHLIMASDHDWVIPAGNKERRYFILDVNDGKLQDEKFFGALNKQMVEGGNAALLHYLWKYDLANFNLRKVPLTTALEEQQSFSMIAHQGWWESKLREGRLLWKHGGWEKQVSKKDIYDDYIQDMKDQGIAHRLSQLVFQNFIRGMMEDSKKFSNAKQIKTKTGERPYVYTFPPLQECRALYEKYTRRNYVWSTVAEPQKIAKAEKLF